MTSLKTASAKFALRYVKIRIVVLLGPVTWHAAGHEDTEGFPWRRVVDKSLGLRGAAHPCELCNSFTVHSVPPGVPSFSFFIAVVFLLFYLFKVSLNRWRQTVNLVLIWRSFAVWSSLNEKERNNEREMTHLVITLVVYIKNIYIPYAPLFPRAKE